MQISTFRWLNDWEGVDPGSCNWHMILVMGQLAGWDCWGSRARKCSWECTDRRPWRAIYRCIAWLAGVHMHDTRLLCRVSQAWQVTEVWPSRHQQSIHTHQPWSPRGTILCSICKLLLPHCETNSPLLSLKAATTSGEPLSMDVHLQGNFTLPHLGWHTN